MRLLVTLFGLFLPSIVLAAYVPLTFRYNHYLFFLDPDDYPAWRTTEEVWTFNSQEVVAPAELRVDGDAMPSLPVGMVRSSRLTWDKEAIRATLQREIASKFNREPGKVTIQRGDSGAIIFDGVGILGWRVDLDEAAMLTVEALKRGIVDIHLPVHELQPHVTVLDPKLQDLGIKEVVAIGESDYRGSPVARRHNIEMGLSKFNGYLVPQGEIFSFNEVLGPVNLSTGYKKELVILGEKTIPDYGGGLCQVSTTAYRGAWEYGFPLVKRRNHSYVVSYYGPYGTDATIYPPYTDIQFLNDSPGALLIQTHTDDDQASFIYYGTRDNRESEVIGPYTWGHRDPPPPRIEYTTDIPAGTTRKVGSPVPGLHAAWFRVVRGNGTGEIIEPTYSIYEARPLFTQIGVAESPSSIVKTGESSSPLSDSALLRREERQQ